MQPTNEEHVFCQFGNDSKEESDGGVLNTNASYMKFLDRKFYLVDCIQAALDFSFAYLGKKEWVQNQC